MRFAKTLTTDTLTLRPLSRRDAWFFVRLIGNPQVRRYLGGPVRRSDRVSRFRQYLAAPDTVGIWIVCRTGSRAPLGLIELAPHKDGKDYEVSYQFHPSTWGQGIAAQAIGAALAHGLSDAGLPRILAETQTANTASRRLLTKLGMAPLKRLHRFGDEQIIFTTTPTTATTS